MRPAIRGHRASDPWAPGRRIGERVRGAKAGECGEATSGVEGLFPKKIRVPRCFSSPYVEFPSRGQPWRPDGPGDRPPGRTRPICGPAPAQGLRRPVTHRVLLNRSCPRPADAASDAAEKCQRLLQKGAATVASCLVAIRRDVHPWKVRAGPLPVTRLIRRHNRRYLHPN